ncbi:MAG: outer membrane beta-barrel protein [Paludibacteraceae bacterium]
MKKTIALLFTLILLSNASAQHIISGSVNDKKTGSPLDLVSVRLLTFKDSSLVQGARTGVDGKFILKGVGNGRYILSISSVGYINNNKAITVNGKNIELSALTLEEDVKVLKEVDVTGTAVQVMVRNDTVEYNAGSVKTTQNAVVEDVLKKLPGVEVDSDGKVTVNGQEIKNIRVDGKKFFSGDMQMATKNIPANMIDKIQVIDQKSDMAQLTGFEDNDTERIINLTLRKDKKQGMFGNINAGAGLDINPEFRYDANAFLNIMNGDTKSTVTAGANNINTSRSGRGRGGFGGGQSSGITTTQNLGYNINTPLNDKLTIGGDGTFNHSGNDQVTENHRENYLKDETYTTNSNSSSSRDNYDGNIRLESEWKPDSLSTILIQPNIGFSRYFSNGNSDYTYLTANDTTSWGNSTNNRDGLDINGKLNVIYSRKFKSKKGRAFTANISTDFTQSNSDGENYSEKYTTTSDSIIKQKNENNSLRFNWGTRLSYVEPLWNNRHFLEAALSFNQSNSNSTRDIYDYNFENAHYNDFINQDYSNQFKNTFYREAVELNYRYFQQKFNMTFGAKLEPTQTYSTTIYGDEQGVTLSNSVVNFSPTAQIRYNFDKQRFLRINYRGRTNQPSISQMQPVKDNTDLMNETVGNPELNPSFTHNLRFMFSTYSSKTFSSFNIGMMGNITKDNLTSNSIYDSTGKRYIQTVNSPKMPYDINMFTMVNTPIIQKRLQFSNNASVGFQQQYGYTSKGVDNKNIDIENLMLGDLSDSKRLNASENLSFTFTNDWLDFGVRGGLKYSNSKNNFSTNKQETFDWNFTPNMVVRPTDRLTFSTDLNYITLSGYSNFNQDQWLWNASLDWTIPNQKGVLSLK